MVEQELADFAEDLANNHTKMECFAWFRESELDDSANWGIYYLEHRDSDVLTRANAQVIQEALDPFAEGEDPDIVFESHSHFLVGHIDGFSIRVYDSEDNITEACKVLHGLLLQLEDYPILDEDRFSAMEYEEACESWESYGRSDYRRDLVKDLENPDDDIDLDEQYHTSDFCPHSGIHKTVCNCGCSFTWEDAIQEVLDILDYCDYADDIVDSLRELYEREVYSDNSGTVFHIDIPTTRDLVEFVLSYQPQTA